MTGRSSSAASSTTSAASTSRRWNEKLARVELGQVQQVGDEPLEAAGLGGDDRGGPRGVGGRPVGDRLRIAPDRGERGPQLMGDRQEELALGVAHPGEVGRHRVEAVGQRPEFGVVPRAGPHPGVEVAGRDPLGGVDRPHERHGDPPAQEQGDEQRAEEQRGGQDEVVARPGGAAHVARHEDHRRARAERRGGPGLRSADARHGGGAGGREEGVDRGGVDLEGGRGQRSGERAGEVVEEVGPVEVPHAHDDAVHELAHVSAGGRPQPDAVAVQQAQDRGVVLGQRLHGRQGVALGRPPHGLFRQVPGADAGQHQDHGHDPDDEDGEARAHD